MAGSMRSRCGSPVRATPATYAAIVAAVTALALARRRPRLALGMPVAMVGAILSD